MKTTQRLTGTVVRVYVERGFCFIDGCNGGPLGVFCHVSACGGDWPLSPGQVVSFDLAESARGPRAQNVQVEGGGQ